MTLTLKIQLRGITNPPVWRRIEIPDNLSFESLHTTIQKAFGWEDYHLYQFQQRLYDHGWSITDTSRNDDLGFRMPPIDSRSTLVGDFLREKSLKKLVYVYDFGDDWVHDITIGRINEEAELDHPVCHAGKGACPPEDCGGPWGYQKLKQLLTETPDSEEAKDYMEWLGLEDVKEFDPNYFSLNAINSMLQMVSSGASAKIISMGDSYEQEDSDEEPDYLEIFREMIGDFNDELTESYEDIYDTDIRPQRYEVEVKSNTFTLLLQVPSNMLLPGLAELIVKAAGRNKLQEPYWFEEADGFRYTSDVDSFVLTDKYWHMDSPAYNSAASMLRKKGDTVTFCAGKGRSGTGTWTLTLKKKGRYGAKTVCHTELLGGIMADFEAATSRVDRFAADHPLPESE